MNLSDLIKELKDEIARRPKGYDTEAEVVQIEDDIAWVQIPGGEDPTPVKLTINAHEGDTVQVRLSGGTAFLVGNATAPPTDDTQAYVAQGKANEAQATADTAVTIAGNTAQHFWVAKTGTDTGAHITEIPQEDFLSDPENGGGNLLARSNGITVRDGLTELADFTRDHIGMYADNMPVFLVRISEDIITVEKRAGNVREVAGDLTYTVDYNRHPDFQLSDAIKVEITLRNGNVGVATYRTFEYGTSQTYSSSYTSEQFEYSFDIGYDGAYTFEVSNFVDSLGNIEYISLWVFYTKDTNAPYTLLGVTDAEAFGAYSITEGVNCNASGAYSHAEGLETTASGKYSHAEGKNTIAIGLSSHAEGHGSPAVPVRARGNYTHAEGEYTYAFGTVSHAEGSSTEAIGPYSHTQNRGTIASGQDQTALGRFNEEDTSAYPGKYAVIIGNGTADDARSNALAVQWDGTVDTAKGQLTAQTTTTTWTAPTIDNNVCTIDNGGYYREGKHVYVTLDFHLAAAPTVGTALKIFTGMPASTPTRAGLCMMVSNALNGMAWMNTDGELYIKPSDSITTSQTITINGHYTSA